jgi:hypothetical protein
VCGVCAFVCMCVYLLRMTLVCLIRYVAKFRPNMVEVVYAWCQVPHGFELTDRVTLAWLGASFVAFIDTSRILKGWTTGVQAGLDLNYVKTNR